MEHQPETRSKIKKSQWTILKLLKWTTSYFKTNNIENPRAAAEILLAHTLELKRIDLYLRYDQPLCRDELALFKTLIKRRVAKEPVAYIVGHKEFWSIDFAVTKDVLIPRPETECLVEAIISILSENSSIAPKRILELGTGSGAIIIAIASSMPDHLFFASDCRIRTVKLANQNARHHNLNKKIDFFCGDWFTPIKNNRHLFDIIVSNPPYIQTGIINTLQPEIYKYEPVKALDGGEDGLGCIKHIIQCAHFYLRPKGILLLEIGYDQKDGVKTIIKQCGNYENISFLKDYSGHFRIVRAQKKQDKIK